MFYNICIENNMTITSTNDVKLLVKQDIDSTDLTNAIALADKQIVALTGLPISEISTSLPTYGALQAIAASYAAWCILIGWDKSEYLDKAKEMMQNYLTSVENYRKMPLPKELENPYITISESSYTIPALNPDIPHYKSSY